MLRLASALSVLALAATGCQLYMGDDDPQPPPCAYADDVAEGAPLPTRDPYSGECVYNTYPPYNCDGSCGPCPEYGDAPAGPYVAAAQCYGACDGLDEASCTNTPGCHAAYASDERADAIAQFNGCWDIAPLPVAEGNCMGLDAWTCAEHDDCISLMELSHGPDDGINGMYFGSCAPEHPVTNSCSDIACDWGTHCEEQCVTACPDGGTMDPGGECTSWCSPMCVPDGGTGCEGVDCGPGYECQQQCDTMDPTTGMGPDGAGTCWPTCVEIVNDPGSCTGDVLCDSLPPACPVNTTAGIKNGCWSGYCIPNTQCGPQDPGSCEPAGCASPSPACPPDTVPGVKDGCYTGYCIPASSCPTPTCESLSNEMDCLNRFDCTPVYTGDDCTCFPDGTCSCTSQTFNRCETWWL